MKLQIRKKYLSIGVLSKYYAHVTIASTFKNSVSKVKLVRGVEEIPAR